MVEQTLFAAAVVGFVGWAQRYAAQMVAAYYTYTIYIFIHARAYVRTNSICWERGANAFCLFYRFQSCRQSNVLLSHPAIEIGSSPKWCVFVVMFCEIHPYRYFIERF